MVAKIAADKGPQVVMLGPALTGEGGIAAVVRAYAQGGLLEQWRVRYLPTHCHGGKKRKFLQALYSLAQFLWLLMRGKVGAVHVHVASHASFWRKCIFMLLARAMRRPVIFHLHGGGFAHFYQHESSALARYLIRYLLNSAQTIIVLSSQWSQWVRSISCNPRVYVIANPVLVKPLSASQRIREPILLFLGRLEQAKGIVDLLEAIAPLCREFPALKLVCGGQGDMAGLRKKVASLDLDEHVDLLGWIDGAVKQNWLERAMIFVLPSYIEGLPMSLLEAMAAGLPIVTTPIGGIPDAITHGNEGLLVAPGDIGALRAALRSVLANAELRTMLSDAAYAKVKKTFSTTHILPQLAAIYHDLDIQPRAAGTAKTCL